MSDISGSASGSVTGASDISDGVKNAFQDRLSSLTEEVESAFGDIGQIEPDERARLLAAFVTLFAESEAVQKSAYDSVIAWGRGARDTTHDDFGTMLKDVVWVKSFQDELSRTGAMLQTPYAPSLSHEEANTACDTPLQAPLKTDSAMFDTAVSILQQRKSILGEELTRFLGESQVACYRESPGLHPDVDPSKEATTRPLTDRAKEMMVRSIMDPRRPEADKGNTVPSPVPQTHQ